MRFQGKCDLQLSLSLTLSSLLSSPSPFSKRDKHGTHMCTQTQRSVASCTLLSCCGTGCTVRAWPLEGNTGLAGRLPGKEDELALQSQPARPSKPAASGPDATCSNRTHRRRNLFKPLKCTKNPTARTNWERVRPGDKEPTTGHPVPPCPASLQGCIACHLPNPRSNLPTVNQQTGTGRWCLGPWGGGISNITYNSSNCAII